MMSFIYNLWYSLSGWSTMASYISCEKQHLASTHSRLGPAGPDALPNSPPRASAVVPSQYAPKYNGTHGILWRWPIFESWVNYLRDSGVSGARETALTSMHEEICGTEETPAGNPVSPTPSSQTHANKRIEPVFNRGISLTAIGVPVSRSDETRLARNTSVALRWPRLSQSQL